MPNPGNGTAQKNMSIAPNPGNGTENEKDPLKNNPGTDPLKNDGGAGKPPAEDYKEKFANSTRENQIIMEREKALKERLGKLASAETPTEEELIKENPNWEYLSDTEKDLVRKQTILDRKINKIQLDDLKREDARRWETDLTATLTNPAYVGLKGKEAEFKEFVYKKDPQKMLDLDTLAQSFLFNIKPIEKPVEQPKPNLEKGSGGVKAPTNNDLKDEDIALIREKDPKLYAKMLRAGQIK